MTQEDDTQPPSLNSINTTLRNRQRESTAKYLREQQMRNTRDNYRSVVSSRSHLPIITPVPVTQPAFTTRVNGTLLEIQPAGNSRSTFINLSKVVDVSISVPSKNQFVISIIFLKKITNELLTIDIKCTQYQEAENLRELLFYYRNKIHSNCKYSTGIHDGITVGTGTLDDNGYWDHPCHVCARKWEITNKKPINACWPFYQPREQSSTESVANDEEQSHIEPTN
jgi:hypothetical protein